MERADEPLKTCARIGLISSIPNSQNIKECQLLLFDFLSLDGSLKLAENLPKTFTFTVDFFSFLSFLFEQNSGKGIRKLKSQLQ